LENTFIELYDTWASWHEKKYAATDETTHLQRSVAALELARYANDLIIEQVAEDPSKLIAIRTNRKLVERELVTAYRLYRLDNDPAWLAKARELFNRSKSLLLDEKIRQSAVVADLSPVEKDSLRTWQDRLQQAESRRRESDSPETLGLIIHDLREDIGGLLDRARQAREARPMAGDYIEYAMLPDSVMALASLGGRTEWRILGARAEFLRLLTRFHDYIRSQGASLETAVSRDLHDFLLRPFEPTLPDELTIVPDGEIGYIPFDMLAGEDHRMLIETMRIAYAYAYATPGRTERSLRPADVLCLAPAYPPGPYARETVARGTLYALPYARMEADSIRAMYGRRGLGSVASADTTVMDSMGAASIFHYAGHAVVDGADAFIALRAEDTGPARLTADELAQAGRGPDLAVLSACETGLGELALGEGIRSLGRSLLEAGAGATVMTLWTVRDGMTARIMIDFHKHLRKGLPIDVALRNAKLDYLATARHEARHPYFWAGIVAAGDMEVLSREK
jgi:CHAT domain-containing protein